MTVSAVASLTLNVATPRAFVTFDPVVSGVIFEWPVPLSWTVLFGTGTLPVPNRVTVTSETSAPLATFIVGEAAAVERVADGVVAVGGADPSPAGVPLSVALVSMKKGCDHRCGLVKSFWLSPIYRMHSVAAVLPHTGLPVGLSPKLMESGRAYTV